jgi:MFS family permease
LFLSFILSTTSIYLLSSGLINYTFFYTILIIANIGIAVFMMGVNVPLNTSMVKVIAPELRGRVFSTVSAISGGAVPIAIFLGGVIVNSASVSFLGILCSALLLVPILGFLLDGRVKHLLDGLDGETNGQLQTES